LVAIAAAAVPVVSSRLDSDLNAGMLVHTVALGDLDVIVTEDGTLESSNNKEIKCRVKGGSTVLKVIETGTIVEPGDVLVELDTSSIEDEITLQEIAYETALANKIISDSEVAVAKISITEYLESLYLESRNTIEKEIFDAEDAVKTAQLGHESALRMVAKGLISSLQLEGEQFALDSARKDLELKRRQLVGLEKYTKQKTVQELNSTLQAAEARSASYMAALNLEKTRLDRAREQLVNCTIVSEVPGMVIFPSAAEWKETPDIEEGATVREQQTLLVIPNLDEMQVKVGVHESKIDRVKVGMRCSVELQDRTVSGVVSQIATVTRPSGWWSGNMVTYDTIVKLEKGEGLKPGMSAVVKIYLARYPSTLTIPVVAVVENDLGFQCWVKEQNKIERRKIEIGDSDDEFMVVMSGLKPGDQVVLNPLAYIDEAQSEALRPRNNQGEEAGGEAGEEAGPSKPETEGKIETKTADIKVKEKEKEKGTQKAKPNTADVSINQATK
jgi:RND family efflux transporter MFP subunit